MSIVSNAASHLQEHTNAAPPSEGSLSRCPARCASHSSLSVRFLAIIHTPRMVASTWLGVKYLLNPTLFPHYRAFVTAPLTYSLFAPCMAFLIRHSGLAFEHVVFAFFVFCLFATIFSAGRIARICFSKLPGAGGRYSPGCTLVESSGCRNVIDAHRSLPDRPQLFDAAGASWHWQKHSGPIDDSTICNSRRCEECLRDGLCLRRGGRALSSAYGRLRRGFHPCCRSGWSLNDPAPTSMKGAPPLRCGIRLCCSNSNPLADAVDSCHPSLLDPELLVSGQMGVVRSSRTPRSTPPSPPILR